MAVFDLAMQKGGRKRGRKTFLEVHGEEFSRDSAEECFASRYQHAARACQASTSPSSLPPPSPPHPSCMAVFCVCRGSAKQVCLEGMIKKKYGKIVNITSQSAVIATKAHAACEFVCDAGEHLWLRILLKAHTCRVDYCSPCPPHQWSEYAAREHIFRTSNISGSTGASTTMSVSWEPSFVSCEHQHHWM